jgi:cell division protein FtsN
MNNEVYEFTFERGQLMKVVGGLVSLVLLVFCAGLLVGVSYQLQIAAPVLMVENKEAQPPAAAPAPVAEIVAPAVEPTVESSSMAVEEADSEDLEMDPDLPAIDPAPNTVAAALAREADELFAVQLGAFLQSHNAGVFAREVAAKGYEADIIEREDSRGRTWYLVRHGSFADRSQAVAAAVKLHVREGFEAVVRPSKSM